MIWRRAKIKPDALSPLKPPTGSTSGTDVAAVMTRYVLLKMRTGKRRTFFKSLLTIPMLALLSVLRILEDQWP